MSERRVLVTGGSGYIGRLTLPLLATHGLAVHAVSRTARAGADGVTHHCADLLAPGAPADLIARVKPHAVLHLAWQATPGLYWTSPDNREWVRATTDLAAAAAATGVARFVGAGSCAEYDWTLGRCDEATTPEVPATLYGRSKLAAWRAVRALQRPDFSTAWGRVFLLFGGDEPSSRLVPDVARSVLAGEPAFCTHGEQVRDFLHVTDVAGALVALLLSPVEGVVNIASGQSHRVREVSEGLAARLGRGDLVRLGARPTDEPAMLTTSATRLRREVGWSPRLSFEEALDETANHWRQRNVSSTA